MFVEKKMKRIEQVRPKRSCSRHKCSGETRFVLNMYYQTERSSICFLTFHLVSVWCLFLHFFLLPIKPCLVHNCARKASKSIAERAHTVHAETLLDVADFSHFLSQMGENAGVATGAQYAVCETIWIINVSCCHIECIAWAERSTMEKRKNCVRICTWGLQ